MSIDSANKLELFGVDSKLLDSSVEAIHSSMAYGLDLGRRDTHLGGNLSLEMASENDLTDPTNDLSTASTDGLPVAVLSSTVDFAEFSEGDVSERYDALSAIQAGANKSASLQDATIGQDKVLGFAAHQTLTGVASDSVDPLLAPQNGGLSTAQRMGTLIGARALDGSISANDALDFFHFQLDTRSDVNLTLSGLTSDADLYLIWDGNSNGLVDDGEILNESTSEGISVEAISFSDLPDGEFYVAVAQYDGTTDYTLRASATPYGGVYHTMGSLRADAFRLTQGHTYSVFSGNGNVDFGQGYRDVLDLSAFSVNSVVAWNPATANGGGIIYDPGNGGRVFDAMTLSSGHQILMEGLDGILFQERFLDFNSGILPNDPMFSEQWNLHMMGVHNAWRFTQGSSNVLVGVQDSGLGVSNSGQFHPDIDVQRTLWMSGNVNEDFSTGETSHGTGVHGIIAADSNNGIGLSGINWNSHTIHIDVLGSDASDLALDEATQIMANHAASSGQRLVVNMSLTSVYVPALEHLIAQHQENVLFVIASGNDDVGVNSFPALLSQTYSNVISVGASWGTQDQYGRFTNPGDRISYPGVWGSNYGYGTSLMGPSEVISTLAATTHGGFGFGYHLNAPAGGIYRPFNGTSAAAPNVTGVASLVWSANPYLSAGQVHRILQETAFDLGFPGYDYEYGYGFVNADAAVRRAIALAPGAGAYTNNTAQNFLASTAFLENDAIAFAEPSLVVNTVDDAPIGQPTLNVVTNEVPTTDPQSLPMSPETSAGAKPTTSMAKGFPPRLEMEMAHSSATGELLAFGKSGVSGLEPTDSATLDAEPAEWPFVSEVAIQQSANSRRSRMSSKLSPSGDTLINPLYDTPWELDTFTGNLLAA